MQFKNNAKLTFGSELFEVQYENEENRIFTQIEMKMNKRIALWMRRNENAANKSQKWHNGENFHSSSQFTVSFSIYSIFIRFVSFDSSIEVFSYYLIDCISFLAVCERASTFLVWPVFYFIFCSQCFKGINFIKHFAIIIWFMIFDVRDNYYVSHIYEKHVCVITKIEVFMKVQMQINWISAFGHRYRWHRFGAYGTK